MNAQLPTKKGNGHLTLVVPLKVPCRGGQSSLTMVSTAANDYLTKQLSVTGNIVGHLYFRHDLSANYTRVLV